ncbi:MAG: hypothetical protein ACXW2G_06640 [Burkholderiaceae bacterium]
MKLSAVVVALTAACLAPTARAEKCVGLAQIQIPANASHALVAFFTSFMASKPPCGSGKAVLSRIVSRDKTGGRKLEPDKPLDTNKAQANVEAAMKDPAIKARIDKARAEISDQTVLLAYEAAIFDDEGYYDARELRVQQLLQRLN